MKVTEAIVNGVKGRLGDGYDVIVGQKVLPNGVTKDTITVRWTQEEMSPSINCGEWPDDMPESEAVDKILSIIDMVKDQPLPDFSMADIDKDRVLDNVLPQVVNADNDKFLDGKVFSKYLDLAVIYRYIVQLDDDGLQSIIITQDFADMIGVTAEELNESAIRFVNDNVSIKTMFETMMGFFGDDEEIVDVMGMQQDDFPPMYVISNKYSIHGASEIISSQVLEIVGEKIGEDYYILPSSIHEFLAVPVSQADESDLKPMVSSVNTEHVKDDEVLSDSVYKYSIQEGRLSAV